MKLYIHHIITQCPEAYYALLAAGKATINQIEIDDAIGLLIISKCPDQPAVQITAPAPIAPRLKPLPRTQWPLWAKTAAALKKPSDIGLGDTLERLLGKIGGNQYKTAFKSLTGRDCGCNEKKEVLNQVYPYHE